MGAAGALRRRGARGVPKAAFLGGRQGARSLHGNRADISLDAVVLASRRRASSSVGMRAWKNSIDEGIRPACTSATHCLYMSSSVSTTTRRSAFPDRVVAGRRTCAARGDRRDNRAVGANRVEIEDSSRRQWTRSRWKRVASFSANQVCRTRSSSSSWVRDVQDDWVAFKSEPDELEAAHVAERLPS